jgi:hypothetical protein
MIADLVRDLIWQLGAPAPEILRNRRQPAAAHRPRVLERIQKLYKIEEDIRGRPPEERCAVRQVRSRPEVEDLKSWFEDCLKRLPKSSPVRDAIQYGFNQWNGLIRFLDRRQPISLQRSQLG